MQRPVNLGQPHIQPLARISHVVTRHSAVSHHARECGLALAERGVFTPHWVGVHNGGERSQRIGAAQTIFHQPEKGVINGGSCPHQAARLTPVPPA